MDKKFFEHEVNQQDEVTSADWATLNESELAAVGGGCAESTPY